MFCVECRQFLRAGGFKPVKMSDDPGKQRRTLTAEGHRNGSIAASKSPSEVTAAQGREIALLHPEDSNTDLQGIGGLNLGPF